ncbi:hypothetical protein QE152_g30454 [Popillia japonica]|uniref:Uncharacterized protein n=1 Tax=Popillia japonica TaxID=7064 RepID=A0AAW1JFP3_POPJA
MDWFRSICADFSVAVCAFFGRNFRVSTYISDKLWTACLHGCVLCSVIIQHDYFKFALLFFYQYGREIWKKRRCDIDIGHASDDNNNQNNF